MAPTIVHLPNGQSITVSPAFGGLFFKANDLSHQDAIFPPGWTIIIHSEDEEADHAVPWDSPSSTDKPDPPQGSAPESAPNKRHHTHRFTKPTLHNDGLYISSISYPSSSEFKPASSPTRQMAMMLWATLYWYFQQPAPNTRLTTAASSKTPSNGKPRGDWRINIKREGVFGGRNTLQKLERMGLVASEDSSVGAEFDDLSPEGWGEMFICQRTFWQLDARIYLFTLSPIINLPFPSSSPFHSRPGSPSFGPSATQSEVAGESRHSILSHGLWTHTDLGPFASSSHLPTYFPPPPLHYVTTNNVRHPLRPKPPRQGETFYTRYIPSLEQYLSYRVPSLKPKPLPHVGPPHNISLSGLSLGGESSSTPALQSQCDTELLHKWMNNPRVSYTWGEHGPLPHQEDFLKAGLQNRHSFPAIGCWDGRPFGYMEIYWAREDRLGRVADVGPWDRGIHCLVGEEEFRGPHRVAAWLSSLVHYCFLADSRTESVWVEPRVDGER
ncbi:MAG: hypothetical protein M1829_003296 [Trizodia sp. TS-e1964]|nr:MAG: hypothetical protein M1829_003296 [Trizodia sp. TS-e1964]